MTVMDIFIWAMAVILLLSFYRAIRGPSIWDRLLGFNLVSTKIVAIVILFAAINDTGYLLDLAIIYALFAFIGEIFIALFSAERAKAKEEKNAEHN